MLKNTRNSNIKQRIAALEHLLAFSEQQRDMFKPKCKNCPSSVDYQYWSKIADRWKKDIEALQSMYNGNYGKAAQEEGK